MHHVGEKKRLQEKKRKREEAAKKYDALLAASGKVLFSED
jgi:hypothetical protein